MYYGGKSLKEFWFSIITYLLYFKDTKDWLHIPPYETEKVCDHFSLHKNVHSTLKCIAMVVHSKLLWNCFIQYRVWNVLNYFTLYLKI